MSVLSQWTVGVSESSFFDVSHHVIAFCSQLVVGLCCLLSLLFSERDGHDAHFFACWRLQEGPTDSLDAVPSFQFEHGLSSFAKLMWQADFSCPSENLLVVPRFSLDLANTSMLLVVGDHLLAAYTSIDWAGRRLRFSGNRPGLDRKSNETRSNI